MLLATKHRQQAFEAVSCRELILQRAGMGKSNRSNDSGHLGLLNNAPDKGGGWSYTRQLLKQAVDIVE